MYYDLSIFGMHLAVVNELLRGSAAFEIAGRHGCRQVGTGLAVFQQGW